MKVSGNGTLVHQVWDGSLLGSIGHTENLNIWGLGNVLLPRSSEVCSGTPKVAPSSA